MKTCASAENTAAMSAAKTPMVCSRVAAVRSVCENVGNITRKTPDSPSRSEAKRTRRMRSPRNMAASIVTMNGAV